MSKSSFKNTLMCFYDNDRKVNVGRGSTVALKNDTHSAESGRSMV